MGVAASGGMLYDNDVLCVWGQFLGGRGGSGGMLSN